MAKQINLLLENYSSGGDVVYDSPIIFSISSSSTVNSGKKLMMDSVEKLLISYDSITPVETADGTTYPSILLRERIDAEWYVTDSIGEIALTDDEFKLDPVTNRYQFSLDIKNLRTSISINTRVYTPAGTSVQGLTIKYSNLTQTI